MLDADGDGIACEDLPSGGGGGGGSGGGDGGGGGDDDKEKRKTFRHTGNVKNDPAASIKLRVTKKGDKYLKVSGFRANNVFSRCNGTNSRIDLRVLDPLRVKGSRFDVKLTDGEGGVLRLAGKIKRGGRETEGNLSTSNFESEDGQLCNTPRQPFVTRS